MLEFILLLVATFVAPIVLDQSNRRKHFEWVGPWLREAWAFLFAFLMFYLLWSPVGKELAMKLHPYWRTYPWLGYLIFGFLGAAVFCGYWWFTGRLTTADPEKFFAASIEGILQKTAAGGNNGPFAYAIGCPEKTLVSIDYMPVIRITNLQTISTSIKSYSLELRDKSGQWERLVKIPIVPTVPNLFFVHPAGYLTFMTANQPLDAELSETTIAAGQSVSGWTFFSFPSIFAGPAELLEARITVSDFAGHIQTMNIKGRDSNADAVPGGHNSVTFSKKKMSIGSYNYIRYTDLSKHQ
jgi:hypothetical protein